MTNHLSDIVTAQREAELIRRLGPPCRRRGCGHPKDWHRHYRYGTDCSATGCQCDTFLAPWPRWLTGLARLLRRH